MLAVLCAPIVPRFLIAAIIIPPVAVFSVDLKVEILSLNAKGGAPCASSARRTAATASVRLILNRYGAAGWLERGVQEES